MTIKEIAERAGLSHQAIYKRLKARGVSLETIKEKGTGELTAEGEALLLELFNLQDQQEREAPPAHETAEPPADRAHGEGLRNQVERLKNQVAELNSEVEKLRNQVATLEEKEKALIDERDFLRITLERSQQLQAITAAKIPNPPPALPAGGEEREKGLRAWFRRLRSGK